MTVGSILLSGAAIALLLGVGQRVLDKMHLTDRAALIIIAAMFVGGLLPDIDFLTPYFALKVSQQVSSARFAEPFPT